MARDYDFIAHVTRFCRILRAYGLLVGPADAASAISAIGGVDMMDYGRVYWTLRSVLVSRQQEIAVFDQLFERPLELRATAYEAVCEVRLQPVRKPPGVRAATRHRADAKRG